MQTRLGLAVCGPVALAHRGIRVTHGLRSVANGLGQLGARI